MPSAQLTIVVTGASKGLGAGMAQHFLERGHRLGLCARTAPSVAVTGGGGGDSNSENVICESVDVRDPQSVQAFSDRVVGKFGRIDLWINNAGSQWRKRHVFHNKTQHLRLTNHASLSFCQGCWIR